MADSPYFDRTYFDPTYFDTDSAASPVVPPTGGRRIVIPAPQQVKVEVEDEDWIITIL